MREETVTAIKAFGEHLLGAKMARMRDFALCHLVHFRHCSETRSVGSSFETRVRALNFSLNTDLRCDIQKATLRLGFLIWKVG